MIASAAPQETSSYGRYLKPKLESLLSSAALDKVFHRAQGDYLYYFKGTQEQQVIDFLGGYGVNVLGHNHAELVRTAMNVLAQKQAFSAQASIRSQAGLCAEKLATMFEARTGEAFITTFSNSGAEAVEAALKHAALERQLGIKTILESITKTIKSLRIKQRQGLSIPSSFFEDAKSLLNAPMLSNLDELEFSLLAYNQQLFEADSFFLALEGAFHGKSSGALKLTFNEVFRAPWGNLGIQTQFVKRNDLTALQQCFADMQTSYIDVELKRDGSVVLLKKPWSQLIACFAEPIQGEGGIYELDTAFLQALGSLSQDHKVPLIFDEIQSGMGRTGAFLASEASGVVADYYLLSKALGGGLAKIAALVINKKNYIEDFGYLHSSTFAEDDYSSAIALKTLELLEEKAIYKQCAQQGAYLKAQLEQLVKAFPDVFKEVRGRGLMLGLELIPQTESSSNLIKVCSVQNLLSYLFCGYLLNAKAIRLAPTLSSASTLRLEPSAFISHADIHKLIEALSAVAEILRRGDAFALVRSFFENQAEPLSLPVTPQVKKLDRTTVPATYRVACIAHFMEPSDLLRWDPSLAPLSNEACKILLDNLEGLLDPFVVDEQSFSSSTGETVDLYLIGVPITAEQIMNALRTGRIKEVAKQIEKASQIAKNLGVSQLGLTGYSSIATNNGTALIEDDFGITSGNSLTAALSLDALERALSQAKLKDVHVAIVGATGNIGRIVAEILAETMPKLTLFGREGSEKRLERIAESLYEQAWQRLQAGDKQGIAGVLAKEDMSVNSDEAIGKQIKAYFASNAPIKISTNMFDLQTCNAIMTASNAPEKLIQAEYLSHETTIICDISVPEDVAESVSKERPKVIVLKGGRVSLPENQKLNLQGLSLEQGQVYACMAETLILGLAGYRQHFSYGALEKSKVKQIRVLSKQHGFFLADD